MENASKALIIAAAILLSILIIALGMRVFNSANSTAGKANMSGEEAAAFNSQFEAYEGDQKGDAVRALIAKIKASNTAEGNSGDARNITCNYSATDYKTNKTYTVTFTYNDQTGCISGLTITDKSTPTH